MLKLKIKHKLLMIWLGSIILTLIVMAGLFEHQIDGLHKKDARMAVANAVNTLHQDLELAANGILQSAQSLSARGDLVASMNMIDRYQDPEKYLKRVFDVEKHKVARELAQHASATGADIIALYDSQNVLAAFYLSPQAGGTGAGYITYQDGTPVPMQQAPLGDFKQSTSQDLSPVLRELTPVNSYLNDRASISHNGAQLVLSTTKSIQRTRATGKIQTVGAIVVGRVLGDDFALTMSQATGMDFRILNQLEAPQNDIIDASVAIGFFDDIPELVLDGNPDPDHSTDHKWVSGENHFIGAVCMLELGGGNLYFIFAQHKDDLQTTLDAFRTTVIAVLLITGLSVVPVGLFFLNRTITRPVENLVDCADNLRRGQILDMDAFKGTDEFSELAKSFQIMSTAVRARELALTESQKSLKNAQRIARIGNWEWDLHTGFVRYSDEIHIILERNREEIGNKFEFLLSCVHEDDVRALKRRISEAIERGEEFTMEHRIILPDGSERYVIHNGEMYTSGNDVVRISATLQDITERHLLEAAKGELISTVSHELRTPLTSITGVLGLAVGGALGDLPDTLMSMLKNADRNAKRLGLLIDDLLDIERISSGSMSFEFKNVRIADIIHQALESNKSYADTCGVHLLIEGDIPDAVVVADPSRMAQVMANLLSNACKFSPTNGSVQIKAQRSPDGITVAISDQGAGIPEVFQPFVFDRFSQADQSLTRQDQKGGTGLGLAITKAILEMHDGTIQFDTTCEPAPSHGTTFMFCIPEWNDHDNILNTTP